MPLVSPAFSVHVAPAKVPLAVTSTAGSVVTSRKTFYPTAATSSDVELVQFSLILPPAIAVAVTEVGG